MRNLNEALQFVVKQYEVLRANFDPRVTKLRERVKVVMHPAHWPIWLVLTMADHRMKR